VADKPADETSSRQLSFEQALVELEGIVRQLEEGEIGLAEGLARYETGVKLLRQCYHMLEQAQNRIELLNRVDAEGNAHCEQFDEGAISLEEKGPARARRRSRSSDSSSRPGPQQMDEPGSLF
jgi:exodeoxyribonuclease VII small subunit